MSLRKDKIADLLPSVNAIKKQSKDPNTKIGAIIFDETYTIRSTGYNGIPRGVDESFAIRSSRENLEKYYWYEHAERNAIYNSIRTRADIRDCYMLLTCDIPCCDCARAIIQTLQKGIVIPKNNYGQTGDNKAWVEHSIRSKQMFIEAGVEILYLDEM